MNSNHGENRQSYSGEKRQNYIGVDNKATKDKMGNIIPAEITVFEDRSFTFVLKTPPASDLLRKAAGVAKGAGNPLKDKVG